MGIGLSLKPLGRIKDFYVDDWGSVNSKRVVLTVAFAALTGIAGYVQYDDTQKDAERTELSKAIDNPAPVSVSNAEAPPAGKDPMSAIYHGLSYRLTGVNTVDVVDNNVRYSFNYLTDLAFIDGPDHADMIQNFGSLPSSTLKDNALKVGCVIASRTYAVPPAQAAQRNQFNAEHC